MENGIQKGKMLSPSVLSNCKAFLLKRLSILRKTVSQFKKDKNKNKNRFKPPFYSLEGGGEMYAKERGSSIAP